MACTVNQPIDRDERTLFVVAVRFKIEKRFSIFCCCLLHLLLSTSIEAIIVCRNIGYMNAYLLLFMVRGCMVYVWVCTSLVRTPDNHLQQPHKTRSAWIVFFFHLKSMQTSNGCVFSRQRLSSFVGTRITLDVVVPRHRYNPFMYEHNIFRCCSVLFTLFWFTGCLILIQTKSNRLSEKKSNSACF